ncbi:hypothetical protein C1646_749703 [Rhizophagus diaphanus]|nr:hypothetical protein C1646_749703 [Rhizophagus diaphanus] [Rhizophagus sp. MUCL 43196]
MKPGYKPPTSDHHTEDFLANQITDIIKKIGPEKVSALVTNNTANCVKAKEIIMEHDLTKITISGCNQITSFFKRSHIVGKLLTDAATTLQIVGGGLKTYCKTRWTSMYETVSSVSYLQIALEIPNAIKKLPSQGMVEFHQHCIESFNKYWNKFDLKVYILAYFLHPAYCACGLKAAYWKTITTTAAQIWQNNGGNKRSHNLSIKF